MNRPKQNKTKLLSSEILIAVMSSPINNQSFPNAFCCPPKGYHSSLVGVVVGRRSVVVVFAFSIVEGSYPGGVVFLVIVINFVGRSQRGGGIR